jgi:hypothetical protein
VPSKLLYRSSISGAILQAQLMGRGRGYFEELNSLLYAAHGTPALRGLKSWYVGLLEELPKVAVTDALLVRESVIVRESFNSIYFGTSTALGPLKTSRVRVVLKDHPLIRDRQGRVSVGQAKERAFDLGLGALDFTVLRSDPKKDATFPSIREVMTARVSEDAHAFWAPGAWWRVAFISEDEGDLQKVLDLFGIVLRDLGMGAKHVFRGKGELRQKPSVFDAFPVTEAVTGWLWQPLICRSGNVGATLETCGLVPVGGMELTLRHGGLTPLSHSVPAVSGEFQATKGYYFHYDGRLRLLSEEDFRWPHGLN